ncbi:MAG: type II toxin-antitoxin system VapB family antitoxin [Lysobacterales bacterium]
MAKTHAQKWVSKSSASGSQVFSTIQFYPFGFRATGPVLPCVPEFGEVHSMRTNIEIDDKLMKAALRATGAKTKKAAVELGLRTLVDLRAQEKARALRGKIAWEGDLNAMRTDQ